MNPPLTRRDLLLLAACLSAGCVIPRGGEPAAPDASEGRGGTLFSWIPFDADSLDRCANQYFSQRPAERDVALLEAKVFGPSPSYGSLRALLASVSERIADDFARDDLVVLDGWTLAVTEVRLWSLVHLILERDGPPSGSGDDARYEAGGEQG